MQSAIVVRIAVLDRQGNVLLLTRSKDDTDRPGDYDFPGGGVDQGEDIFEAILRELQEEAGIVLTPKEAGLLFGDTRLKKRDNEDEESVTRLLFYAVVDRPEVNLSFEHEAFSWVPLSQALELFQHPVWTAGLKYGQDNHIFDKSEDSK